MRQKTMRARLASLAERRWKPIAASRSAVSDRAAAMVATAGDGTRRGTRKRSLVVAAGGFGVLASLFGLVSQNVLAVNFTTANTKYKVYTDKVSGEHAAGYLNVQDLHGPTDDAVAQIGFKTATLNGLCAIAQQTLPVIGPVSLMIVSGETVNGTVDAAATRIQANELYLATDSLTGNGDQIAKMTLGQSADTLGMDGIPFQGTPGAFGLQAQTMNVSNLDADTYGIDLQGQINLPDLQIKVQPGAKTKADCATP